MMSYTTDLWCGCGVGANKKYDNCEINGGEKKKEKRKEKGIQVSQITKYKTEPEMKKKGKTNKNILK